MNWTRFVELCTFKADSTALCLDVPKQFCWFPVIQTDYMFIGFNKLATAPFVYFFLRYSYFEPNIVWDLEHITLVRHVSRVHPVALWRPTIRPAHIYLPCLRLYTSDKYSISLACHVHCL